MPDMQVAVGLGWETGYDFLMFSRSQLLIDNFPDKIGGRRIVAHGKGLLVLTNRQVVNVWPLKLTENRWGGRRHRGHSTSVQRGSTEARKKGSSRGGRGQTLNQLTPQASSRLQGMTPTASGARNNPDIANASEILG